MLSMARGLRDTRSLYEVGHGEIITVEVIPHDGRPAWFRCWVWEDGSEKTYCEGMLTTVSTRTETTVAEAFRLDDTREAARDWKTQTPASLAIGDIRAAVERDKISLDQAAQAWARINPKLTLRVMEDIGSWPSSEPELAALQRAWSGTGSRS